MCRTGGSKIRLILLVAFALVANAASALAAYCQISPTDKQEKNIEDVSSLMNAIEQANGGKAALRRWNTFALYGTQTISSAAGAVNTYELKHYVKNDKLRIELKMGSSQITTIYNGKQGFRVENGKVFELPPESLKLLAGEKNHRLSLLSNWQEEGYKFRLVGRTYIKQNPVFALVVEDREGAPVTFYVDALTFLVAAFQYETVDPELGGIAQIRWELSDYKNIGGTMVPLHQVQHINNKDIFDVKVASLTFGDSNDVVPDYLFDAPNAIAAKHLAEPVQLSIDYFNKEIVVKGRINGGEELDFLVDTGSNQTIIDRKVGSEFLLEKQNEFAITGASGVVTTAASKLRKLEIGGAALEDVPIAIVDLTPQSRRLGRRLSGVLGTNVLSRFTLALDIANKKMILSEFGTNIPEGNQVVSFAMRQGPVVKTVIDGKYEVYCLLDTGSTFNHLPIAVAKQLAVGQKEQVIEAAGFDGNTVRLSTLVVNTLALGTETLRKVRFAYFLNPDGLALVRVANLGILGNPFLENYVATFDFKGQKLYLKSDAVFKAKQEIEATTASADNSFIVSRNYRLAEVNYLKALELAQKYNLVTEKARLLGRLGNMRRAMAKDLKRPEQGKAAYAYFSKALSLARQVGDRVLQGRILADWSLLYSDLGQGQDGKQAIDMGLQLAPDDPQVNVDAAVHLYRAGMYPAMSKFVERALSYDPTNWQALWYKVRLFELYNDVRQQKNTLNVILRYYPASQLAKEKLQKLL